MRCSNCRVEARWLPAGIDGPPGKRVFQFACSSCHRVRLQLADLRDLQVAVEKIVHDHMRATRTPPDGIDREDFVSYLTSEAWSLWLRYEPDSGVPFTAYAFKILPLRANDYYRMLLGRSGKKHHGTPTGLGVSGFEAAGDPLSDRDPDLSRLLGG